MSHTENTTHKTFVPMPIDDVLVPANLASRDLWRCILTGVNLQANDLIQYRLTQKKFDQHTIAQCKKVSDGELCDPATDWAQVRELLDFLDEHPEHVLYAIADHPYPSGNEHFDNLLAAVAEKLADDAGISRPPWCALIKPYVQWWPKAWTPVSVHHANKFTPPQLRMRNCVVDKNVLWKSEPIFIEETRVISSISAGEIADIYANARPARRTTDWWGDPEQYTVASRWQSLTIKRWGTEVDSLPIRKLIDYIDMHPQHIPYAIATCPPLSGNEHLDVLLAAVAEKLADDAGIPRPTWCAAVKPYVHPRPISSSPQGKIKALKFTPPQFMARDLLLGPGVLWNIRNPITGAREIDPS
jgi:hypothetical protein